MRGLAGGTGGGMDAAEWPARSVTFGGGGPCWILPQRCLRDRVMGRDSQKREKRKQEEGRVTGAKGPQTGETWIDRGEVGGSEDSVP